MPSFSLEQAMNELNEVLKNRVSHPKAPPQSSMLGRLLGSNKHFQGSSLSHLTPLLWSSLITLPNWTLNKKKFQTAVHLLPAISEHGNPCGSLFRPPKDLFVCSLGNFCISRFYI